MIKSKVLLLVLLIYNIPTYSQNKPNIILIQTDQQRYDAIGVNENSRIITPNLNKLSSSGVYFTHTYATSPVCMPSRWSLQSGMYTSTNQCYSNHHVGIEPATSLPEELKKVGYSTALLGKNHTFLTNKQFDVFKEDFDNGFDFKVGRLAEYAAPWPAVKDPMALLTDDALKFLKERKNNQPFYLFVSYLYPHTPYQVPEPYFSMYKDHDFLPLQIEEEGLEAAGKPFRQIFHKENNDRLQYFDSAKTSLMRQTYYGMVSLVDDQVGRILAYLEENDMDKNTIIVFTSDHGDYMGDHGLYTKSPAMYDVLVRVPLIISWPGKIPAARPDNELISHVDIMPTLLSFAKVQVPRQVQGFDLSEKLKSSKWNRPFREFVVSEYGLPGKSFDRVLVEKKFPDYKEKPLNWAPNIPWEANPVNLAGRFRMIRTLKWKLVEYEDGNDELYDMVNDPFELKNLSYNQKYSQIKNHLKKELAEWKNQIPGTEKDNENLVDQFISDYREKRNQ